MNLQQIAYVLAISEVGSFSQAATKCCVTQSTLSTMVSRLEEEIGIRIFDRKTKPVSVTKEGETILRQLKHVSKEVSILHEVVQALKGEWIGEVNIGVIPTVAPYILPRFLNEFARQFPSVDFSISEVTTEVITEGLLRRDLDIGILTIPLQIPDLIEIPLYNEPFLLYDCSGTPPPDAVNLEQLDLSNFWLLEEGHCLRNQVKTICDYDNCAQRTGINFDFRAGSIDSLIRFVKINQGRTMLPYLAALDFTPTERQRLCPFTAPVPVRTVGLVVHKHFVKQQLLTLLQSAIQTTIVPLLQPSARTEQVVAPA